MSTTTKMNHGLLGGYTWDDPTSRARLFGILHELSVGSGRVESYYSDLYHDALTIKELKGDETLWYIARTNGTHLTDSVSWRDAVLDSYSWDKSLAIWRVELSTNDYKEAVLNITEGI